MAEEDNDYVVVYKDTFRRLVRALRWTEAQMKGSGRREQENPILPDGIVTVKVTNDDPVPFFPHPNDANDAQGEIWKGKFVYRDVSEDADTEAEIWKDEITEECWVQPPNKEFLTKQKVYYGKVLHEHKRTNDAGDFAKAVVGLIPAGGCADDHEEQEGEECIEACSIEFVKRDCDTGDTMHQVLYFNTPVKICTFTIGAASMDHSISSNYTQTMMLFT